MLHAGRIPAHYRFHRAPALLVSLLLALIVAGCSSAPVTTIPGGNAENRVTQRDRVTDWHNLPGWSQDQPMAAWSAFQESCTRLKRKSAWKSVCHDARSVDPLNAVAIQHFFETRFTPYRITNSDGSATGLITGYYEPILRGSRVRGGPYQTPLYRYPRYWKKHTHVGPTRRELRASGDLDGTELVWVDDPVEAAYLQIQGSGRVELTDGTTMRVAYAGTNNQPFQSFARRLIERGEITPAEATLPGVRAWAKAHPDQVETMLDVNPRVVFFRELAGADALDETSGPIGALGVPLTSERSIAVDPDEIPLGAPVFLSTTQPLSNQPLQRLMVAQDTGSAVKGAVRADFYWGHGDAAGEAASRMKQRGEMWVLLPR
ncbi:murein transglycosylase A [Salinicola rhizosphaerae]|uniref:Membrane-bound lytic murein transglycosylase A n=1 Tax=Salinicola rhizosphaerae TaxID=1443141 RepID=A0ABQ3DUK4_9GAMM|nr:MltA domain-containing protein [Salinicola rhizosphaerae]GHB13833.1 murein transglycosylase [Salinicola rhizosphaerae]